jgi:DnaJ-class molecular chaperone
MKVTTKPYKQWKKLQGKINCHVCNGSGWDGSVFVTKCKNCNSTGKAEPTKEQYMEQLKREMELLRRWR